MPTVLVKGFFICDTAWLSKVTAIGTCITYSIHGSQESGLSKLHCWLLLSSLASHEPAAFWFDLPIYFTPMFIFSSNQAKPRLVNFDSSHHEIKGLLHPTVLVQDVWFRIFKIYLYLGFFSLQYFVCVQISDFNTHPKGQKAPCSGS